MGEAVMLFYFLVLLTVHWMADFVLQTHWQAQNKSKNNVALYRHVLVYTTCISACTAVLFGPGFYWLYFVWLNFALHFATDYVTSRVTSRLYVAQKWHDFFVVIGLDQLIHQTTLAATMFFFFGER